MGARRGRRNRPTAYEVSFGVDDPDDSTATSDSGRKRDRGGEEASDDLRVRAYIFSLVTLICRPAQILS